MSILGRGIPAIEVKRILGLKTSIESLNKILDMIKEGREKKDKSLKKFINANLNV